jgi:tRNA acetyltransferase TAN1
MPGDSGIFATCNKGREPKCVGELRDLFAEYAEQLYGGGADEDDENDGGAEGIENDIKAELAGIQKPPTAQLFVPVKLDVQCGELTSPLLHVPECVFLAYIDEKEVTRTVL